MSDRLERACLAIADVSGYTGYLMGVELDHAQDILADLMSTIVEAMVPFQLSKLEGDAAFSLLPGAELDGSTIQDVIESTYVAFRARLRDVKQASACDCNACVRIPTLGLKFVVHHGEVARQRMLGFEELVGRDVILVHRLLKNRVTEATGAEAYVLYTQAVVDAAGMEPRQQGLTEHHEETDVAGDVTAWVRDLQQVWQALIDLPRIEIEPEHMFRELTWQTPAPPPVVFDYLTSPILRPTWDTSITALSEMSPDGRRGIGTTNHCVHGKDVVTKQIVDWRPPHYWLTRDTPVGLPGGGAVLFSDELSASPGGGTAVLSRIGSDGTLERDLFEQVWPAFEPRVLAAMGNLVALLEALAATDDGGGPAAPVSMGRHLSEPMRG